MDIFFLDEPLISLIYKTIIDENPANKEAYLGIIKNELMKGNPDAALQYTNRSLMEMPNDRQLVKKKIER